MYSLQGADCASCADAVRGELKKIKGIKKVDFDKHAVELTIRMADGVSDQAVLAAIARSEEGIKGIVGGGQGAYLPVPEFPPGADVQVLTRDGSAVGPLPKLAVPGKYTVFDVFAEWCGPCREVDARLREVVTRRRDVAIRKLNVRDFDTPLALELGAAFETPAALAAYTIGAAQANGLAQDTGSLEAGKAADLIVLSTNLFALPHDEITTARVLLTLVEGHPVFRSPELDW